MGLSGLTMMTHPHRPRGEQKAMTDAAIGAASPNPAEIYERMFVPAIHGPWADVLLARVAPQPGERVIDVACGTGAVARRVAPLVGADGGVTGVDSNHAMLEVARSLPAPEGAPIAWVEGTAESLPVADQHGSLVLCQQGVQFFADKPAAAREMHRVLAPGGRVGLSTWRSIEHQPVFAWLDQAIEQHLGALPEAVSPFSFGDGETVRSLLETAGFQRVTVASVTGDVRFAQPDLFAELTIRASAAVLPEYDAMDDNDRADLVAAIRRDLGPRLVDYTRDGDLVFPMTSHIVIGYA